MSEMDEGLRAIILDPNLEPHETVQAILDHMCKHRGCEPELSGWRGKPDSYPVMKGPCIWCGKEAG